jgi:acetyltransferase-like isoleucine patch superfamily enzyme
MKKKIIKTSNIKNIKKGKNLQIVLPCNIYECIFGDNCFVGPFVEIQKNTKIGSNSRIQSHTFVCEGVNIGTDVFVGHGVMFVNDIFKNGKRASKSNKPLLKTIIGNNVNIGSNSTILPVYICNDVTIGAGSVVTKSILTPGIYFGNPAIKKK